MLVATHPARPAVPFRRVASVARRRTPPPRAMWGSPKPKDARGESADPGNALVPAQSASMQQQGAQPAEFVDQPTATPTVRPEPKKILKARTLAEDFAASGWGKRFTLGLTWWTPMSPIVGYDGVGNAVSRLWENTVLLSGLIASLAGFAVVFPNSQVLEATPGWTTAYFVLWTLTFCFTVTSGFVATILLNKMCKCAPQNMPLWFAKFGGFVEVPQLFLYLGGWTAFGGLLACLHPLYKNDVAIYGLSGVSIGLVALVTKIYSQTTDFEKACAKVAAKNTTGPGVGDALVMADYSRRRKDAGEQVDEYFNY